MLRRISISPRSASAASRKTACRVTIVRSSVNHQTCTGRILVTVGTVDSTSRSTGAASQLSGALSSSKYADSREIFLPLLSMTSATIVDMSGSADIQSGKRITPPAIRTARLPSESPMTCARAPGLNA